MSQSAFARVLLSTVIVAGSAVLLSACGDVGACSVMPSSVIGALPGNPAGGGVDSVRDNPTTGSNAINGPSSCD